MEAQQIRSVRAVAMAEAADKAEENAAKLAREREKERREAAERRQAAERAARERREAQQDAPTPPSTPASAGSPRDIARAMVSSGQWGCFDAIITRESGWNPRAVNPSSGAYGLPQALPGHKMASAGGDWRTNPATQVRWAISYMNGRYGSPCGAWSFWQANHWY